MTDEPTSTTPAEDVPVILGDDGAHEADTPTLKSQLTWSRAAKAYKAAITAVLGVAAGLSITQFVHDGAIDTNALGVEGLSLAGLFVITFLGAWLPKNAPAE